MARDDHHPSSPPGSFARADGNGHVAAVGDEQLADDQTASDLDQASSDADQTASDADQAASDRDQARAEIDNQRASDRDQAAHESERRAGSSLDGARSAYEASRAERLEGTLERGETTRARARTAAERLEHAAGSDDNARLRDLTAETRDRAAEQRDLAAERLDRELDLPDSSLQAAQEYAAAVRARAAADRAHAASDREQAEAELRQAQLDHLTGAFGRELGMVALEREINRARHGDGRLVLAFVDVDGLKQVNDLKGHAAGDALLRDVVGAIQEHLRSYDPIVRVGGDEFVCALAGSRLGEARIRFEQIRATIEQRQASASISVGFAALRPRDTLEQLIERGDTALYEAKQAR